MSRLTDLAARLAAARRPADWTALVPDAPLGDAWHVPPDWLDPLQDDLDERARREISRFVLAGIQSASAHAERRFTAAASALDAAAGEHQPFLCHLISEETEHADAFEGFARSACGGLLPDRLVVLGAGPAHAEDAAALAFGRLLVAEEIVDTLDLALARDERVHPAVRALHAAHHADEARHLAFGRAFSSTLAASSRDPGALRRELASAAAAGWRAAFPVEAFRRAGHPSPAAARAAAWQSPALVELRRAADVNRFGALRRRGLIPDGEIA